MVSRNTGPPRSGLVMVMVIVLNSEQIKVGNGNPRRNIEKIVLEFRSRYR